VCSSDLKDANDMEAMDTDTLQQELLDLLILLQNMNPLHLAALCKFVHHTKEELLVGDLTELLKRASAAQIDKMVAMTVAGPSLPGQPPTQPQQGGSGGDDQDPSVLEMEKLPKELVNSFGLLFQLYQLHQLLGKLSILQLMKIFEFVPPGVPQVQQLQLLQQLQQLLGQLLPETLISLHQELEATQGAEQHQVLSQLLQLRKEHFHLYQPLRMLLQLETEELLGMQEILPKLQPIQMLQLLALLQLQPFDVLELKRLFQPQPPEPLDISGQTIEAHSPSAELLTPSPSFSSQKKRWNLRIIEQPPEKSVYKRNLKPNPTVQLVEDEENSMETNLYVAPILIRCDTLEEKSKLMTGNKPVKVAPGRVVSFRRLKITSTSHQQGESLFAIKFELRRYHGNEYEILDFVQSNPICVLSHSTQLRPASSTTATVTEVIPYSGSTQGGTRVAVLGNNFVDSPSARVRFDNTDVMPTFHGPRTLICVTPQHQPGIVSVRVSNDSKVWSPTAASFTYEERKTPSEQAQSAEVRQRFDLGIDIASSICEAAWQGGFETVKDIAERNPDAANAIDDRNYSPLHYTSSLGHHDTTAYLLEHGAFVHARDGAGNTPMHWACYANNREDVELFVEHGANMNLPNIDGATPLHIAASFGHMHIVSYLAHHGARLNLASLDGDTALHRAAAMDFVDVTRELITHGAHLDVRDNEGDTPLHYAVREEQLSSVAALLSGGASPSPQNDELETPLHLAVLSSDDAIARHLLQAGANPNARDRLGRTPLHEACINCHHAAVSALIEAGAKLEVKDIAGRTALQYAIESGADASVSTILVAGGQLPMSLTPHDAPKQYPLFASTCIGKEMCPKEALACTFSAGGACELPTLGGAEQRLLFRTAAF